MIGERFTDRMTRTVHYVKYPWRNTRVNRQCRGQPGRGPAGAGKSAIQPGQQRKRLRITRCHFGVIQRSERPKPDRASIHPHRLPVIGE